jgi:hypothetical protein
MTAKPSCLAPITHSATITVSTWGTQATRANEAATRPQLTAIEIHERQSFCASSSRISWRDSASRQRSAGLANIASLPWLIGLLLSPA